MRARADACRLHLHNYFGNNDLAVTVPCSGCDQNTLTWVYCCCPDGRFHLCPSCAPRVSCSGCQKALHLDSYYHCGSCIGNLNICEDCFANEIRCAQLRNNVGLLPEVKHGEPTNHKKIKDPKTAVLDERWDTPIVVEKSNMSWDDVAGLQTAKNELQEAIISPMRFPERFAGRRKPCQFILFYGPPGTGKSSLARAVAAEVDCTMFSISGNDVLNKGIEESEKLVKFLFEVAHNHKPAIIFIDEIEALCGKRGGDNNEASERVKTEFFVQIDGVSNSTSGITVIGATNLPWQLDTAILRQFQRRIYIGLPDHEARIKVFQIHTGPLALNFTPQEFKKLATMSEGLSGSDISDVVQDALIPVRKIYFSTHYLKVSSHDTQKWKPCFPYVFGAEAMTWHQVYKDLLLEHPVKTANFYEVLKHFKSSVNDNDVRKAIEWRFGLVALYI